MGLKEAKAFADAAPNVLHEVGNKVEAMHYLCIIVQNFPQ
ncbi:hypothetical protein DMI82_15745 [Blautia sp. BCRC 81119]|nr:hypothetical protein DMI82_15745 [Blautia sp. BCRC 81119]